MIAVPFKGTRVIHPRWSAHHRPVTDGAMNATVRVVTGVAGADFTYGGGFQEGTETVGYVGPARVTYEPTQGRDADATGQDTTVRRVTVALPGEGIATQHDAVVHVTDVDANGLLHLKGAVLVVESVGRSSHAWEQLLSCLDDQTNQPEDTP